MPKRTDIQSILVIGAGPIIIGQACEFDYSGTQAIKALKAEGYRVILINSNPATIMTDPDLADATYIEPITPEYVAKVIAKERPDALLPTVGGQTALNCTLALIRMGVLERYRVELIGASKEAIEKAENRQQFKAAMEKIGLECPRTMVVHNMDEAALAKVEIGLPAIIRPSFTLGGKGSGIAYTPEQYDNIVRAGLAASPIGEVLVDESVIGWKEYELEVVRDKADNCIIVCSIENIDPMGVHTGDSITVAPALTLSDKEYQRMRDAALAVLREIGVDTGGSNVQFAVNPADGRMLVIEMNPRVSRSSALASKATGFPIAKVAARLAVGYTLDEIRNDCTETTPASFEPTIDYIVTKIPRFTFEKFSQAKRELGSAMQSVGETMAIGRSFKESLQKALRSLETGLSGLVSLSYFPTSIETVKAQLAIATPERLLLVGHAFRLGLSVEEVHAITSYDLWYLRQLAELVACEQDIKAGGLPQDADALRQLKMYGFSDQRLAELSGQSAGAVRELRHKLGVRPVYKRVDTCASEFAAATPYFYSCYEQPFGAHAICEASPSARRKIIILGSGPNRIGQGVEFDYACVHAAYALAEAGYETIMINCNPETVSTDYDTSDRLYFEPLTSEDVLEVIHAESQAGTLVGVIVQFGGQTPLKLAKDLHEAGVPILGTSYDAIDLAEDRDRFQKLLYSLGLRQPSNATCATPDAVAGLAEAIGYPLVIRPSYVLGGRAMEVLSELSNLQDYLRANPEAFAHGPLLLDKFLSQAIEVDVDALADGSDVYIAGIMEHIEAAGIHSGDSACSLPHHSLTNAMVEEIIASTKSLAKALRVVGLMNIQFAIKDQVLYVLEVNPRASRTVPFVAKATGVSVAKIAARLMGGETLASFDLVDQEFRHLNATHCAVKAPVFPFERFTNTDIILGPEMKSTGEVMGIDTNFAAAYAKAMAAAGNPLPDHGMVFVSVKDEDKPDLIPIVNSLIELGFEIIATNGTKDFLAANGLAVELVNKVAQGSPHIVDRLEEGSVDLIINTTEGKQAIADSFSIRRTALLRKVPYTITIEGAKACMLAIRKLKLQEVLDVAPIQDYFIEAPQAQPSPLLGSALSSS